MGSAGSWAAVSPTGLVWEGSSLFSLADAQGGRSWASALALGVATTVAAAFWWRSGWQAGAGRATPATDKRGEIAQSDALRHTPVEERTGGGGEGRLKSRRCLRVAFN